MKLVKVKVLPQVDPTTAPYGRAGFCLHEGYQPLYTEVPVICYLPWRFRPVIIAASEVNRQTPYPLMCVDGFIKNLPLEQYEEVQTKHLVPTVGNSAARNRKSPKTRRLHRPTHFQPTYKSQKRTPRLPNFAARTGVSELHQRQMAPGDSFAPTGPATSSWFFENLQVVDDLRGEYKGLETILSL